MISRLHYVLRVAIMERTIANATDLPITIDNVYEAEARIRDEIYYTPVVTSTYLNNLSKYNLHFKCENLQKTGSFKVHVHVYFKDT